MISIIDYGGGNVGSVRNALDFINAEYSVTDDIKEIRKASKIILPGQGRFGDVMTRLREKKLDIALKREIFSGKPYLGICIGLQILFECGEEDKDAEGLGILKGTVPKFGIDLKVPQIGWNKIIQKKESLFLDSNGFFYFVHSYFVKPKENHIILAQSDYGTDFTCAIEKDNILAVQFHPEKSGEAGLNLLRKWCLC
jgi:glutamine amidotransferase